MHSVSMQHKRVTYISPLIDAYLPNASHEEKQAAQTKLWVFVDALARVYVRMEKEGHFPTNGDKSR